MATSSTVAVKAETCRRRKTRRGLRKDGSSGMESGTKPLCIRREGGRGGREGRKSECAPSKWWRGRFSSLSLSICKSTYVNTLTPSIFSSMWHGPAGMIAELVAFSGPAVSRT